MKEFDSLVETLRVLHGPRGCPWNQKQTLQDLPPYLIEEVYELVEAIQKKDPVDVLEELGDLFYLAVFCSITAEDCYHNTLPEILEKVRQKIQSRHDHVFGDTKVETLEEVADLWEKMKKKEKVQRQSMLDGIPKNLPALTKARKLSERMRRANFPSSLSQFAEEQPPEVSTILKIIEKSNVDLEVAIHNVLWEVESSFRKWEANS